MKTLIVNPPPAENNMFSYHEECCIGNTATRKLPYKLLSIATYLRLKKVPTDFLDLSSKNFHTGIKILSEKSSSYDYIILPFTPFSYELHNRCIQASKRDNKVICIPFPPQISEIILRKIPDADICIPWDREITTFNVVTKGPENCDSVVFRDAGSVINTPQGKPHRLSEIPIPSFDLFYRDYKKNKGSYDHNAWIQTSFGCPYHCSFCSYRETPYSAKKVSQMVKEIIALKKIGISSISFLDLDITLDRKRVLSFCEEIIERNLKIALGCDIRADRVDEEIAEMLGRAGFVSVVVGAESGSQTILDNINKGLQVSDIIESTRLLNKNGIACHGSFILGLTGETKETISKSREIAKKAFYGNVYFHVVHPFVGTPMWDYARENQWFNSSSNPFDVMNGRALLKVDNFSAEAIGQIAKDINEEMRLYYSRTGQRKLYRSLMSYRAIKNRLQRSELSYIPSLIRKGTRILLNREI
jgi:anaerobic magnesium-protoporphyrin IX monomethyl ester cyclase